MSAETEKVVLVTGSSSGFGRLTVETLARQGYRVFAGIRDIDSRNRAALVELRNVATTENLKLEVVEMDVASDASVEKAVALVIESAGRLDVVVNNAGILANGPLEAYSAEQVQLLFNTNVFSVIRVNRAVLPYMRRQGSGLLIQLSSILGRQALPFIGLYAATKFAIEGLAETYRQEVAGLGIDVVLLEPSAYQTKGLLVSNQFAADSERIGDYVSFLQNVGEFLKTAGAGENPQDIADAINTLIATPAGKRPFRTVLAPAGQSDGLLAINKVTEQVSAATLEAFGWSSYTTIKQSEALAY